MKIKFITYGCKVNRYETEKIRQELIRAGAADAQEPEDCEYCLVNSCTVTSAIDSEILRAVKKLKKQGKKIILTGCRVSEGAQENGALVELADFIIPNERKLDMSAYAAAGIAEAVDVGGSGVLEMFSDREKAFVKASDGCSNSCAYCVIPSVRGHKVSSRKPEEIVREISALTGNGFREIILTGVNLGLYASEVKGAFSFIDMLRQAAETAARAGARIRLSSIGPRETTDDVIDLAAASGGVICPHFHLSLQSGDDTVLKMMKRNYDTALYAEKALRITSKMPAAAITTDIIAGFPGETDAMHRNTVEFIKKMPLSRLHVFPYSDRPGTAASAMAGKVNDTDKKQRAKELSALGKEKMEKFEGRFIGKTLTMLTEENGEGYTENYIRLKLSSGAKPGTLQRVALKGNGTAELA